MPRAVIALHQSTWLSCKMLLLAALTSFRAFAGDCYIPYVLTEEDKDARFCHAEQGIDVTVRAITDIPLRLEESDASLLMPMMGAHFEFLKNTNVRAWGVRASLKWGVDYGTAYNVEAEAELVDDKLICPTTDHCFLLGNTLALGANYVGVKDVDNRPLPYVRSQIARFSVNSGYLYSRSNRTFIVKVFGQLSGDWNRSVYDPQTVGVNGDVGAQVSFHSVNQMALVASIIEHYGLFNHKGRIREGQFKARIRILRDPDSGIGLDRTLFNDIHLQFMVRAFEGEMTNFPKPHENIEQNTVKVRSLMGEAGVLLEF